jgi:hypothetical protein
VKVGMLFKAPQEWFSVQNKWCSIVNDFKKIYDFMACTRDNQDYWIMGIQEKKDYPFSLKFQTWAI